MILYFIKKTFIMERVYVTSISDNVISLQFPRCVCFRCSLCDYFMILTNRPLLISTDIYLLPLDYLATDTGPCFSLRFGFVLCIKMRCVNCGIAVQRLRRHILKSRHVSQGNYFTYVLYGYKP